MHRGDSMIKKYTYGKPFQTESVVVDIAAEKGQPDHGNIDLTAGFSYTFGLEDSDMSCTFSVTAQIWISM